MKKLNIVSFAKRNEKFLAIDEADNTLATIVMLGEVDVYWLDALGDVCYSAIKVTDPKTIYGASPHCFGIKLP